MIPDTIALSNAIAPELLETVSLSKECHKQAGLLFKFLHAFRFPVRKKLNRDPEKEREDQQEGKKNQRPLLTTGKQIKLPVKSSGHLRLNVTKSHKSPNGREKCNDLAVDAQCEKKGNGQGCYKFHQEHEKFMVSNLVFPITGKFLTGFIP